MGFLRRTQIERPADPLLAAVEGLRRAGADPTQPHETRHFIYVPGVKAAQQLARSLRRPERRIEIETSTRKGYWLVIVIQSVVVTPESIRALRDELEAAAATCGAQYDRWQVVVANA